MILYIIEVELQICIKQGNTMIQTEFSEEHGHPHLAPINPVHFRFGAKTKIAPVPIFVGENEKPPYFRFLPFSKIDRTV